VPDRQAYKPNRVRYFLDADTAFAKGDYEDAARLYDAALDRELEEVDWVGSREELLAYARFRLGLTHLLRKNPKKASEAIEGAIARYPVSLHGKAAVAFRNAINLTQVGFTGHLSDGCRAASEVLGRDAERFREVWYYGYANPQPSPSDICPF
jgi:tetratricopeptide (TPR) repeat protein